MKLRIKYLVLFMFLLGFKANAQNEILISQVNCMFLVEGYDTKFELGFSNRKIKKFNISCKGCEQLKIEQNFFVVQPKIGVSSVQLNFIKKKDTLSIFEIPVIKIYTPELLIDGISNNDSLKVQPTAFQLRSQQEYLHIGFAIKRYEVKVKEKTFIGFGSSISDDLRKYLKDVKSGEMIIKLFYLTPNNENKSILTSFRFAI